MGSTANSHSRPFAADQQNVVDGRIDGAISGNGNFRMRVLGRLAVRITGKIDANTHLENWVLIF